MKVGSEGGAGVGTDLGEKPGVLEFSGPDAVRFLNGQVTQDVRKVKSGGRVLPSCVTDAKGKLQFRVWLGDGGGGEVLVFCRRGELQELKARLTRYLIADEVEVREVEVDAGDFGIFEMDDEERIRDGTPGWGRELKVGMLPPEAGLDETDISYEKGCYIGQEVISRIKSAGKVNRRLVRLEFQGDGALGEIHDGEGKLAGEVTSVFQGVGLGYLKRGAAELGLVVGGVGVREIGG